MIVLDASFLVAYHNRDDVHHDAALDVMERLVHGEWGEALVPEYVFLEVVTVLALRRDLATAVEVGETLLRARETSIVPCSGLFLEAFDIFRTQPEARLSFADAAIVAVAREHDVPRIATFDGDLAAVEEITPIPA